MYLLVKYHSFCYRLVLESALYTYPVYDFNIPFSFLFQVFFLRKFCFLVKRFAIFNQLLNDVLVKIQSCHFAAQCNIIFWPHNSSIVLVLVPVTSIILMVLT